MHDHRWSSIFLYSRLLDEKALDVHAERNSHASPSPPHSRAIGRICAAYRTRRMRRYSDTECARCGFHNAAERVIASCRAPRDGCTGSHPENRVGPRYYRSHEVVQHCSTDVGGVAWQTGLSRLLERYMTGLPVGGSDPQPVARTVRTAGPDDYRRAWQRIYGPDAGRCRC